MTIGNKLQPCVNRLGPDSQALSHGMSQPPLNVMRLRTSWSLDARNKPGLISRNAAVSLAESGSIVDAVATRYSPE